MIIENYYHILWLDITATQKQIDKRWKEILKYLAIWDIPDYPETDFLFTKKYRNETFTKDALNGLRNPKIRLQHIFFWINLETEEDKDILVITQKWNYIEAITEVKKLRNIRNKAIFLTLLLSQEEVTSLMGKEELYLLSKEAIDLWNIILTDDRKWNSFKKSFYLYDDISTNEDLIDDLKKNTDKILADIFFDISKIINSSEVTKYFTEIFHVKGTRIHWKSEEIYLELGKISEKLENIKVSDDWIFDDTEKNQISTWIEEGKKLIADLSELGLGKDSKTVVMQDKLTSSIRTIALDLWNNLDNENKSGIYYIKEALQIVWTEGLKSKLEDDLNTMDGEMKFSDSFKKIIKNIEWDEPEKALKEIIKLEAEITWSSKEWLIKLKKRAVFDLIGSKFIKAKKLFEDKNFSESIHLFDEVEKLVRQYLEVFDWINPEGLANVVNEIKEDLEWIKNGSYTTDSVFSKIDTTRESILEKLSEQDWYLAIFYIDSITYWFLAKANQVPAGKIKPSFLYTLNGCGVSIYWDTTYITILWIPILPLSRWNVVSLGWNQYQFSWKKEMEKWKTIWKRIVLWIIGLFLLFTLIENNSSSSSSSSSSYKPSSSSYSSPQFDLSNITTASSTNTKSQSTTNKQLENSCALNQCSFNWKCVDKPKHASCTTWSKTDAWMCDSKYKEEWTECMCRSGQFSCPTWVDTDEIDQKIKQLETRIQNTYVDEYSKASVNAYNAMIEQVNSLTKQRNTQLNNNCTCK